MKQLVQITTIKFKYDSEEERKVHVKEMENLGWECTGKIRNSDSFYSESYWYGEFFKYE